MEKPTLNSKPRLKQLTSPAPPPPLPEKALGELIAKSPPESPQTGVSNTLQSRGSEDTNRVARDDTAMRVLAYGSLQVLCGVLMIVLGVLALVHRSSMSRCAGGLWGGGAALATGLTGILASMRAYHSPGEPLSTTGTTVYLALNMITMAVSILNLVLASTGLLRDIRQPPVYEDDEVPLASWAPLLPSAGLLLVTTLLLVSLVVAALRVYRQVCPCSRTPSPRHRLLESPASSQYATSKQGLVHSWLGLPPSSSRRAPVLYPHPALQPGLFVYPPTLLVDSNGLYNVPPSSISYPQRISPLQAGNPYMQRRRSPHPHRGRQSVTPDSTTKKIRRPEKKVAKEKEITDEQLAKTYTGLDREIAEEFISIAMTNSQRQRASVTSPSSADRVIHCIAPIQ